MSAKYTVPLSKVMKELSLNVISMPCEPDEILISSMDVNRPGLELNGFYDFYDTTRILIFGNAESAFLNSISSQKRKDVLNAIFSQKPPAAIIARGLKPLPELLEAVRENAVPLLSTAETTSSLVAALVSFMNVELAPRITRHGVLVEVYGEGILLVGDSGVGKSETAIELIKRGHRLIADDAVTIKRVSAKSLVGEAPDNIKHFIELRGIGIINARRIFGMGAVKVSEKIDMVINLEIWDNQKIYDRMGIDSEFTEILGIKVPVLTIPVKPGRNLAIIIEVAAMNNRQKKMGYNAAEELLSNLGMDLSVMQESEKKLELNF
ncbi:HPr kinase/phosphorylase [Caprobacter fermentans]|uniref:HPr kinase/phosphorylase n=1 Tax=Caproicibacter fermentans TaxID=2576756 RepID=A0A6N8I2B2_9FIRM|nr:HPr(Ser) kinase/phosphatase [Caproicibacter fermentans]MVB11820.1 HPr kinase/phosphorylase [Caproicibacter fermentans]OCN00770.1 HPr kinase/phosphorylase [Clostridium sp. W14A]QNK41706.1 HPr(Ser) kinase/phosphatase [Caproicibacter fermentans]